MRRTAYVRIHTSFMYVVNRSLLRTYCKGFSRCVVFFAAYVMRCARLSCARARLRRAQLCCACGFADESTPRLPLEGCNMQWCSCMGLVCFLYTATPRIRQQGRLGVRTICCNTTPFTVVGILTPHTHLSFLSISNTILQPVFVRFVWSVLF